MVAVVEDAHWADQATAEVVQWVGKRIDRAPALLIVTARIDALPVGHPMQRAIGLLPPRVVKRIELGPLTQQGIDQLAADQSFDHARLRHLTGGNPFFVTELIAAGNDAVIPGSVRDVVLARTATLSPEARQLVDLVSVVPSRAERSLLAAADEILGEVEAAGILRFDTEWVWFRHELARRAVEGELSAVRREALNRAGVRWARTGGSRRCPARPPCRACRLRGGCGQVVALGGQQGRGRQGARRGVRPPDPNR